MQPVTDETRIDRKGEVRNMASNENSRYYHLEPVHYRSGLSGKKWISHPSTSKEVASAFSISTCAPPSHRKH
jgi:hypothetical protein